MEKLDGATQRRVRVLMEDIDAARARRSSELPFLEEHLHRLMHTRWDDFACSRAVPVQEAVLNRLLKEAHDMEVLLTDEALPRDRGVVEGLSVTRRRIAFLELKKQDLLKTKV